MHRVHAKMHQIQSKHGFDVYHAIDVHNAPYSIVCAMTTVKLIVTMYAHVQHRHVVSFDGQYSALLHVLYHVYVVTGRCDLYDVVVVDERNAVDINHHQSICNSRPDR
jgi:hypothetical protein